MDDCLVGLPMAQPTVGRGQSGHRMHMTASRFNVGLLVEAGDGGGGAPVPSGCSRTSLFIFFCLGDVGEGARRCSFFAGG